MNQEINHEIALLIGNLMIDKIATRIQLNKVMSDLDALKKPADAKE